MEGNYNTWLIITHKSKMWPVNKNPSGYNQLSYNVEENKEDIIYEFLKSLYNCIKICDSSNSFWWMNGTQRWSFVYCFIWALGFEFIWVLQSLYCCNIVFTDICNFSFWLNGQHCCCQTFSSSVIYRSWLVYKCIKSVCVLLQGFRGDREWFRFPTRWAGEPVCCKRDSCIQVSQSGACWCSEKSPQTWTTY